MRVADVHVVSIQSNTRLKLFAFRISEHTHTPISEKNTAFSIDIDRPSAAGGNNAASRSFDIWNVPAQTLRGSFPKKSIFKESDQYFVNSFLGPLSEITRFWTYWILAALPVLKR